MTESKPTETTLSPSESKLLSTRIADLQLSIKGTRLEPLLNQLYRELEAAELKHFKPGAYLSDEWGCPADVPVIGIPFYLASPELCALECQLTGVEAETDGEIMMYLRHESGHAFNYAYKLFKMAEWAQVFGDYSEPYKQTYGVIPFSSKFVRHIPGWYAQKHPDDDFAETFAIWLTPGSNWRQIYAGTPALRKLSYVDELARSHGQQPFKVSKHDLDTPIEEMTITLDSWYRTYSRHVHKKVITSPILNEDLKRAFPDESGKPASDIIAVEQIPLVYQINEWTGLERHVLSEILDDLINRIKALELKIGAGKNESALRTFAIIATTLAMNYVSRGKFVE